MSTTTAAVTAPGSQRLRLFKSCLAIVLCIAISIIYPPIASAAPVIAQSSPGNLCSSGAATCSVIFSGASTSGNYIIVAGYDGHAAGTNVTISDGVNTYTQILISSSPACSLATDGDTLYMSYAKATTNATLTITMADGGFTTGTKAIMPVEVSGLATSAILDKVSSCANQTDVTSLTTAGITTTAANEFLFAVFGADNGLTFTAGSGYSSYASPGAPGAVATEDEIVASTGTYNASMSVGSSAELAGFLVAFPTTPIAPPANAPKGHAIIF
jgi:hypothetical protein